MDKNIFMNIAHRGASGYYPENTLIAFKKALEMGIKWLECDVRLTADKEIVVIHDRKVDRTTDGKGLVSDYTLKELKQLDAGFWFDEKYNQEKIPTLAEVMKILRNGQLVVEIKDGIYYPEIVNKVVKLVRELGLVNQIIISAFHMQILKKVKKIESELKTAALVQYSNNPENKYVKIDGGKVKVFSSMEELISKARKNMVDMVCPPAEAVTGELVKELHEKNFLVRAWGLSNKPDRKQMQRLIRTGINGMTTNYPDILAEIYTDLYT
ncbi:MAG: glycerophosphodiester phosphodiesterase [Bacillota bacterium]